MLRAEGTRFLRMALAKQSSTKFFSRLEDILIKGGLIVSAMIFRSKQDCGAKVFIE
jgi:hypothetical protein